jgi:colanic acid/amylovoran biosynthesis glycosyltransferase
MKVGFFLLKFPLSSETFVLNQITAFIDMGYDVEIIALQKGDTQNTHAAIPSMGWRRKPAGCRMSRPGS